MKHRVIPTPDFEKELRPLLKRHRSLAKDLLKLEKELEERPDAGKVPVWAFLVVRMRP